MGQYGLPYMIEKRLRADIPLSPTTAPSRTFDPGHAIIDMTLGDWLLNVGSRDEAIFTDNFSNRVYLEERFRTLPGLAALRAPTGNAAADIIAAVNANPDIEYVQPSGTATVAFATGGGVMLTTGATSGNNCILQPNSNANRSAWRTTLWNTRDLCIFDVAIRTTASIADIILWAGLKLTSTPTVAADATACFFRVATTGSTGTWQTVNQAVATDILPVVRSNRTILPQALAANAEYRLTIRLDRSRIPHFFINGLSVGRGSAATDNTNLIPFIGIQTNSANARSVVVRALRCSKQYT